MSIETPESAIAKERFEAGERFVRNRLEPIIADKDHEIYILTDENSRLLERIATLERQLDEVTKERDEESALVSRLMDKLEATKHDCCCEYDEPGTTCMVHAPKIQKLAKERDTLRTALRQVAEALMDERGILGAIEGCNCSTCHALALPAVQEVLRET